MRLHEFEAADIFESAGIPVPRRGVAGTVQEAVHVAGEIGYPVMVKAQVLVGGRGLGGGIKSARSPEELKVVAEQILTSEVNGLPVRKILVAEKAEISRELYVGITVHGYTGKQVVVVSTAGGVHIEETVRTAPDKIASIHIDPSFGFYPYQARMLLRKLGLDQNLMNAFIDVISQMYKVLTKFEALIVEINPLAVLPNGGLLAVDGVLEVDDSALSRLRYPMPDPVERIENPRERRGKEIGVSYVDLDGDIGLISSGAGLGMASMDIIGQRMRPANFLETGGGITADLLY
jgi:succinyl-CoA synthetase beta subunit